MPGPRTRGYEKPKDLKGTLKRILGYMSAYRVHLIVAFIGIIGNAGATVSATYLLRPIINSINPKAGEEPDWNKFTASVLLMAVIYLCGVVFSYLYSRMMLTVSTGTLKRMRVDMFRHMQDLPIRYFDTRTHGEIMSRYTNDIDAMREMLSQGIPQLTSSIVQVVGVFCVMLWLSWQLTLLVLAMLFVMLRVVKVVGGRSANYFIKQQRAIGVVNGYIEEMIEGQKVVKVFCHEPAVNAGFDSRNEELRDAASNAHTFANILMPIMGNLSHTLFALVAAVGAGLAIGGWIDLGVIASFLQYIRQFTNPITQISQQLNSVLMAMAGAERIFALIDEPPETDEGYVTLVNARRAPDGSLQESDRRTGFWAWKHPHEDGTTTYTELKGDVRFEDVTFGYEENKTVLRDVTLYAKPGQKIAFVGSTGAGKTTITNLINRFYDVPDGKIRYDGININKIKKADLRRSLAMVLQDTHLFTGTVRENIRYGKLDATDEEVVAAAKLANADAFIRHLPQGYDTVLTSDGANLSQGQRQLLAIARAAIADPPVLILDEATSSIDTRTEALIEKGMDTLMQGRTVFVIAHRLSTVRNADAILVLEHGSVIERGNHDALLAQKGKYYQLYTGMFELD